MMCALSLFPNFDPLTSHFRVTCRPFRSLSPSHSFILFHPCPGRLSLFFSMTYSLFLILAFLSAARAANDWNTVSIYYSSSPPKTHAILSKPCLSGVCSYDLPTTNGSAASGSMKIVRPFSGGEFPNPLTGLVGLQDCHWRYYRGGRLEDPRMCSGRSDTGHQTCLRG